MKFHGKIGYANTVEQPANSGIWIEQITEVERTGDVIRSTRQLEQGDKVNDDLVVQNSISIVADQAAVALFTKIKYLEWVGVRWTVTSVEVKPPRLILNIGDVYNGPLPPAPEPEE